MSLFKRRGSDGNSLSINGERVGLLRSTSSDGNGLGVPGDRGDTDSVDNVEPEQPLGSGVGVVALLTQHDDFPTHRQATGQLDVDAILVPLSRPRVRHISKRAVPRPPCATRVRLVADLGVVPPGTPDEGPETVEEAVVAPG